jgi:hypothetical protein
MVYQWHGILSTNAASGSWTLRTDRRPKDERPLCFAAAQAFSADRQTGSKNAQPESTVHSNRS